MSDQFQDIRNRQSSNSLVLKAKHYNADVTFLLAVIQNLKADKALKDSEKRELAELRQLKEKIFKFISTCGIKSMPTAGVTPT